MGERLSEYYLEAGRIGSVAARMKLAILTGITSVDAAEAADSPELIEKFEAGIEKIRADNSLSV